jgi:hypothetical protein
MVQGGNRDARAYFDEVESSLGYALVAPSPRWRGEGRGEGLFPPARTRGESPSPGMSAKGALIPTSPRPKSGLPDFGTLRRIEIGNSRFRLRGEVKKPLVNFTVTRSSGSLGSTP